MLSSIRRVLSATTKFREGFREDGVRTLDPRVDAAFEAFEDRRMLTAAALVSQTLQATQWLLVVNYTDTDGIDTSTLGNGDVRVTGVNDYDELGTFQYFVRTTPGSDNSVRAVYAVPAPDNAWSYADNGSYTVVQIAGTVTDSGGSPVPGSNLQTFGLFFSTPRAQVLGAYTTNNEFVTNIRYSDNTGIDPATIGFGEVGLRRASDPTNIQYVRSQNFFQNSDGSWTVTYRIPAIGGSWDWQDNGAYDLVINGNQVRDLDSPSRVIPAQSLHRYGLWFNEPKAAYVSTSTSPTDWVVTIRYTDNTGIDTSTIGRGDVSVNNGLYTTQGVPINTVVESPTSVLVTYTLREARYGWGSAENGTYVLSVNEDAVRDVVGTPIHQLALRSFGIFFDMPSVSPPPPTNGATSTNFQFAVTYTDNTGIDINTVGNGDFRVEGPNGFVNQATLISKTTRVDSQGRTVVDASYRFTPTGTFASGTYRIFMNANQVSDNTGHFAPAFQWARYDFTF